MTEFGTKIRLVSAVPDSEPPPELSDDVDELIRVVRAQVRSLLRRYRVWTIDGMDEDDIVHEMLMSLMKDNAALLKSHDPKRGSWRTFVRVVVDSRVKDIRKKQARRISKIDYGRSDDTLPEVEDPRLRLQGRVEAKSTITCVRKCLQTKLPEDTLQTYTLRVVEGLSYNEVTERLGITHAMVNNRIYRSREMVASCARHCGSKVSAQKTRAKPKKTPRKGEVS